MQLIAMSWLVYRPTDSPFMLDLVNLVAVLPVGLVSLVGGVLGDRFQRRRVILTTQTVLAVQGSCPNSVDMDWLGPDNGKS